MDHTFAGWSLRRLYIYLVLQLDGKKHGIELDSIIHTRFPCHYHRDWPRLASKRSTSPARRTILFHHFIISTIIIIMRSDPIHLVTAAGRLAKVFVSGCA